MTVFFLIFLLSPLTYAQDFFSFLSPHSPSTSIQTQGTWTPPQEVDHGPQKSQLMSSSLGMSQRLFQNGKDELSLGGSFRKLDLSGQRSDVRDYYQIQGSLNYRRLTSQNRFWSASLSYGSASDRPFKNGRDGTIGANYLKQMSSKWFVLVNYSNNRSFLNNIPLPGFFYVKEMKKERGLILGFPIIYWMAPLNWGKLSLKYFSILPWTHRLRLLYTGLRVARPYIGFEQSPETFFRHDRQDKRDRFFWFEKKLAVGAEGFLGRGFRYDVSGGLAFDREFFEAKNYGQAKENGFRLANGYFLALGLSFAL